MSGSFLERLATRRAVALAVVAWLLHSFAFFRFGPYSALREAAGGASLPEERFGYTAGEGYSWLEVLGDGGRAGYAFFQLWDVGNALLTAVALGLALGYALPRLFGANSAVRFAAWLPVAVVLLELAENSLLYVVTGDFPQPRPGLVRTASVVSTLKLGTSFALFPMVLLSYLALLGRWLLRRFRSS